MRFCRIFLAAAAVLTLILPAWGAIPRYSTNPDDFVSSGMQHFWVNGRPFRFTGFNVRGLVHFGGNDVLPWSETGHRRQNLDYMQSVGARVARVFASSRYADKTTIGNRLDAALAEAAARNIYLIVCFTDLYNSGFYPKGDELYHNYSSWNLLNQQWFTTGYTNNYLPLVTYLVNRFKNDPTVFAWQLGNELKCPWNWADLLPFSHQVAAAIRAIDSRHMVSQGTAGRGYSGLTVAQALQLYEDFDFITIHPYNGDEGSNDSAIANTLGKPLLVSEAGFSSEYYDFIQRPIATDNDIAKWVSRGARGYMNWGLMATSYDMGDGDHNFGIDKVLHDHSLDWDAYAQVYANWSAILANTPLPPPEAPTMVEASDDVWPDRVEVNWTPTFAAEDYAVYRSEPVDDSAAPAPQADVNLLLTALGQSECGHFDEGSKGVFIRDGNLSTKWCCAHNGLYTQGEHWIAFDLGSDCLVTSFVVSHASTGGEPSYLNTTAFYIESGPSLSGPWTVEFAVNNSSGVESNTLTSNTPTALRCIRLRVVRPNPNADWVVRIPEFEVWGTRLTGGPTRISDWQTATTFVDTAVTPGKRYQYSVKARNEGGTSPFSVADEGSAAYAPLLSVSQAKALPDASDARLVGGVVSAAFEDGFYLQQPDRATGIRVVWNGPVVEGKQVSVLGVLVTQADGERCIIARSVSAE